MSVLSRTARLASLLALPLLASTGCVDDAETGDEQDLTSASGVERRIEWDSFVYVPEGASDDVVRVAIQRQVKSAIGSLRGPEIGIQDRDALSNLNPQTWVRDKVDVVDPKSPSVVVKRVDRVKYRYVDTAIVRKSAASTTQLAVPLLFGDYVARASEISPVCSDDPKGEADSLWFHFTPGQPTCKSAISKEQTAISTAAASLTSPTQVSTVDEARKFVTVRAAFSAPASTGVTYPEYDRLWGFGTDRTKVVVYAFFGVDSDIQNTSDNSLVEYLRFLRTVRASQPKLGVTQTNPTDFLLDYYVDGAKVSATYEDVFRWVVDNQGFPAAANTTAKKEDLKKQAIAHFAERWVYWSLPVKVSRGAETRDMTVEIRTYWGYEDGTPERRQAARWRYLEGMWHGDVFLYQGHSHFGHGPLEPTAYNSGNFPDRYQTMLINSCVSFNYYDVDFLKMHPGGTKNLDIVVNGLPAYWTKMGEASGNYVASLLDGKNKSWESVLQSMTVKPSWAPSGYDPLRAVNGETDNQFDPSKGAISVTAK